MHEPATIHRYSAGPAGAFVNAYLVESETGVVAIDGTLTVSDGRGVRRRLEETGKPLLAVLITHAHPDHYGGVVELVGQDDVPVIATAGVAEVIRRDDALKEEILRPMFGDEWPEERRFPDTTVADGDGVTFGGLTFTVRDLGPGESPHDSIWLLGPDGRDVFAGDQVYNHLHAYLADGFHESWLANIDRLRAELPPEAALHVGHGDLASVAVFDWQEGYIRTFVDAVTDADWSRPERAKAEVIAKIRRYLPTDELAFLMELSIEPVAAMLESRVQSSG